MARGPALTIAQLFVSEAVCRRNVSSWCCFLVSVDGGSLSVSRCQEAEHYHLPPLGLVKKFN